MFVMFIRRRVPLSRYYGVSDDIVEARGEHAKEWRVIR